MKEQARAPSPPLTGTVRGWLGVTAGLCLLAGLGYAGSAWAQYAELGQVGGYRLGAAALGVLAAALTPLALRRLAGWRPARARPFTRHPAWYRLAVLIYAGCFLALLFGSRDEGPARFGVHVLGAAAFLRLALCFPGAVQAVVDRWTSWRALRVVDVGLTNLVAFAFLAEVALRLAVAGGLVPLVIPGEVEPFANTLRATYFGAEPNELGYNDGPFRRERPPGTLRLAAIGDSFFVAEVPRPFGVIARVEEALGEAPRLAPAEVYNFGIVATSPIEHAEVLRRHALGFAPDAVLVGVYLGNDITRRESSPFPFHKAGYALYQLVQRVRYVRAARDAVATGEFVDLSQIERQDRAFWYAVGDLPEAMSRAKYLEVGARHLAECARRRSADVEAAWVDTLDALAEMHAACAEAGVPMLLVISPDQVQVSDAFRREVVEAHGLDLAAYDLDLPQRRLEAFCRERSIPCLDLTPAFRAAPDVDRLFHPNDNHWSAPGNELAGRAIAGWLSEVLPPLVGR